MKSYVHDTLLFTLRIWKLFPREVALVQFTHELSTTMFVLINKDYRKKIGRTNRSPRITVYILQPATRAISSKFILLLPIVFSNLFLNQLISSTNLHPNTKKFHS